MGLGLNKFLLKLSSQVIFSNLCLGDLSKSFSRVIMSNLSFLIFFSIDFARWRKLFSIVSILRKFLNIFCKWFLTGGKLWGYPTLLILWFINFNFFLFYSLADCGVSKIEGNSVLKGVEQGLGLLPWTAGIIGTFGIVRCGGVILSPNWILTAAHCFYR